MIWGAWQPLACKITKNADLLFQWKLLHTKATFCFSQMIESAKVKVMMDHVLFSVSTSILEISRFFQMFPGYLLSNTLVKHLKPLCSSLLFLHPASTPISALLLKYLHNGRWVPQSLSLFLCQRNSTPFRRYYFLDSFSPLSFGEALCGPHSSSPSKTRRSRCGFPGGKRKQGDFCVQFVAMQGEAIGIPGRLVSFLPQNASLLPLFILKQWGTGNKDLPVHVFGKKHKRRLYC